MVALLTLAGMTRVADEVNRMSPQAWLAVSDDPPAQSTGEYFYHQQLRAPNPIARDVTVQDELLSECARVSGITLPE